MPKTVQTTENEIPERETPAAPIGAILQSAQLRTIAPAMRDDPLVEWLREQVYQTQDDPNAEPSKAEPTEILLKKTVREQAPFYWETLITIGHSTEALTTTIADCERIGVDPELRLNAAVKVGAVIGETAVSPTALLDGLLRRALQRHRLRLDLHRQSWALWQDQVREFAQLSDALNDLANYSHVSGFVERFLNWQGRRDLLTASMTAAELPVPAVPDTAKVFELVVPSMIATSVGESDNPWYAYLLYRTENAIARQIDLSRAQAQENFLANQYRGGNPFEHYGLGGAPPDVDLFRLIRENQLEGGLESVWLSHWKKQIALSGAFEREEPHDVYVGRSVLRRGPANPPESKSVLHIGATLPSARKSWTASDLEYVKLVADSVIKQRTFDKWRHFGVTDVESLNLDIGDLFEKILANLRRAAFGELGADPAASVVEGVAQVVSANIVNLATEMNRSGYQFEHTYRAPGEAATIVVEGIKAVLSPLIARRTLFARKDSSEDEA